MNPIYFIGYDNKGRPDGQTAGTIDFSGQKIILSKVADGIILRLAYSVTLRRDMCISVSGITAEIGVVARQSPLPLALGIAVDPQCHVIDSGYKFPSGALQCYRFDGNLQIPLSFVALEAVERFRQGDPFDFTVSLNGCVLVRDEDTKLYDVCRLQVDSGLGVRFLADRDNWNRQVRNISPIGCVLVEIPLSSQRTPPWNEVWDQLQRASDNLAQGGETGCKNCVSEVRQALEAWRKIDSIGVKDSKLDRQKNKEQRLHDLVNTLFHYCSLSAHTDEHPSTWARADAVLALATLCGLLSARNP